MGWRMRPNEHDDVLTVMHVLWRTFGVKGLMVAFLLNGPHLPTERAETTGYASPRACMRTRANTENTTPTRTRTNDDNNNNNVATNERMNERADKTDVKENDGRPKQKKILGPPVPSPQQLICQNLRVTARFLNLESTKIRAPET